MLRGGQTLDIGWAVMLAVPFLIFLYYKYLKKDEADDHTDDMYVDGKPSKKSNVILAIFLGFVALMLILAIVFTPI